MAFTTIRFRGLLFLFGDGSGNFYETDRDETEIVNSGIGDDRIIVSENRGRIVGDGLDARFVPRPPDVIDTEAGDDTVLSDATRARIQGGDGNDSIVSSGDRLRSGTGPDGLPQSVLIYGDDASLNTEGHGDDIIVTGEVDEFIDGGGGIDTVSYEFSESFVSVTLLEADPDGFFGGRAVTANGGEDVLERVENVIGSQFNDFIFGNELANDLRGRRGADNISGGEGDDVIYGQRGNDILRGDEGDDFVHGSSGRDELYGGAGNDGVIGGSGNDLVDPGSGNNDARGGRGIDTLSYQQAEVAVLADLNEGFARRTLLDGSVEIDTLRGFENVVGSIFNDAIVGTGGANTLDGRAGNDQIGGLGGNDVITGGAGFDLLLGNRGSDAISGGTGNDIIDGGFGDDFVFGNEGADGIRGGPGSDIIDGGSEADDFFWFADDISGPATDRLIGFRPFFGDEIILNGIYDPSVEAEDVISATQVGDDVALVLNLAGTGIDAADQGQFNNFLVLDDFEVEAVDLSFWQSIGVLEFV